VDRSDDSNYDQPSVYHFGFNILFIAFIHPLEIQAERQAVAGEEGVGSLNLTYLAHYIEIGIVLARAVALLEEDNVMVPPCRAADDVLSKIRYFLTY
jgi:hypothetical protein